MEVKNKSNILKIVGNNIKKIRLLRGYTQENLAEKLNKTVNMISLVERGESGISIHTIVDICTALDIDANSIFAEIIPQTVISTDSFITEYLNLFDENDKAIVVNLINYIVNSKH